jgi:hypothetical protein
MVKRIRFIKRAQALEFTLDVSGLLQLSNADACAAIRAGDAKGGID